MYFHNAKIGHKIFKNKTKTMELSENQIIIFKINIA